MKAITRDLGTAALGSFILVLPFVILEVVNGTVTRQDAPSLLVLFGLLWLLPTVFLAVLMTMLRGVRVGSGSVANPRKLLLGTGVVLVLALLWGGLVTDQMPCFLGVPNCD